MAKKPSPPQTETCDACRYPQPAPLQRLTVERVEIKVCRESGPCIGRARVGGLWKLQEAI